jgi:cysteine desulfurase/selenocysteine lyase
MPPYQGGGDMIRSVTFEKTHYAAPPAKFEAGTPHISGVIGLGAACDWLTGLDRTRAEAHERSLLAYGTQRLAEIPGLSFIGTAAERTGALNFVLEGAHPHDAGTILDHHHVAVRAGHHCTQPLMARFGVPATIRASLAVYNTHEDIDALVTGLH